MSKWEMRFLELARHVAQWSKDPSTKVGAVIVDKNRRVVSMGFNGFARNTNDMPERYSDREEKHAWVLHAEENAIIQASEPLRGMTIYTSSLPCTRCTARIIQAGILRVVGPHHIEDPFTYRTDYPFDDVSRKVVRELIGANVRFKLLDYKWHLIWGAALLFCLFQLFKGSF